MNKICVCCNTDKPVLDFSKDRQKNDGFSSYCRACLSIKNHSKYKKHTGRLKNKKRNGISVSSKNEYAKQWRNENIEKVSSYRLSWEKKNRPKLREKGMRRYASQTQQTPPWLKKSHLVEMEGFYQFCQIFPEYQVDHIVPIGGKEVSGLHVPWNLQVITRSKNVQKSNIFNPSIYPQQGQCAFMES